MLLYHSSPSSADHHRRRQRHVFGYCSPYHHTRFVLSGLTEACPRNCLFSRPLEINRIHRRAFDWCHSSLPVTPRETRTAAHARFGLAATPSLVLPFHPSAHAATPPARQQVTANRQIRSWILSPIAQSAPTPRAPSPHTSERTTSRLVTTAKVTGPHSSVRREQASTGSTAKQDRRVARLQ